MIQGLHTPPDLVVSDLGMPVMNGEALGAWICARHPALPMVFVSGFGMEKEDPLPGPLLSKPFTMDALCDVAWQQVKRGPQPPSVLSHGRRMSKHLNGSTTLLARRAACMTIPPGYHLSGPEIRLLEHCGEGRTFVPADAVDEDFETLVGRLKSLRARLGGWFGSTTGAL